MVAWIQLPNRAMPRFLLPCKKLTHLGSDAWRDRGDFQNSKLAFGRPQTKGRQEGTEVAAALKDGAVASIARVSNFGTRHSLAGAFRLWDLCLEDAIWSSGCEFSLSTRLKIEPDASFDAYPLAGFL